MELNRLTLLLSLEEVILAESHGTGAKSSARRSSPNIHLPSLQYH